MISPIFGQTVAAPSNTAVNSNSINSTQNAGWFTSETARHLVAPTAMTLSQLYFKLGTAPGGTASYTFTIRKNSVDTALTVTITGAATSATDSTNSVTFAAGDLISVTCTPTGTPALSANIWWNMQSSTSAGFALMGGTGATGSTTVTNYLNPIGTSNGGASYSATEVQETILVPTAGTLSNLYTALDISPGTGASYTFTLMKNGAAQTMTAAISGATATSASDTTNSVTVVAGDLISIKLVPSATAPVLSRPRTSMLFTPTTDGESFFGFGSVNAPSATLTHYEVAFGIGANGWNATETARQSILGPYTLKAMYVSIGTAPGGTATRTFTIRKNAANSTIAATVPSAGTTANVTAQTVAFAQGDLLSMQATLAGAPAAVVNGVHTGVLIYVAPAGTVYNQATAGVLSFVGDISRATNNPLAGVLSFSGGFVGSHTANLALTGGLSFTGAISRVPKKVLAGVLSFTGAFTNRVSIKTLTAVLSFVGSFSRKSNKALTAVLSFTGNISKTLKRILYAFQQFNRPDSAVYFENTASATGTMSTLQTATDNMSIAVWFKEGFIGSNTAVSQSLLAYRFWKLHVRGGVLNLRFDEVAAAHVATATVPNDSKAHLAVGTYAWTGGTNSTMQAFIDGVGGTATNATVLPTTNYRSTGFSIASAAGNQYIGAIQRVLIYNRVLTGAEITALYTGTIPTTPIGDYEMQEGGGTTLADSSPSANAAATLTGLYSWGSGFVQPPIESLVKAISHGMVAALSFVGSVSKGIVRSLSGALSFTGLLNTIKTGAGVLYSQALTASLSFVGAISRLPQKNFTGGLSFTGAFVKGISRKLTAVLSFTGGFSKGANKSFVGVLSFTGAFKKSANRVMTAGLSFVGAISKRTSKFFTAVLSFTGAFTRLSKKNLTGGLSFTGVMSRRISRAMTATLSFTGNFGRQIPRAFTAVLSFTGAFTSSKFIQSIIRPIGIVLNSFLGDRTLDEASEDRAVNSQLNDKTLDQAANQKNVNSGNPSVIINSDSNQRNMD